MSLRIIRIAAALAGCVLLLAGCIRRSELTLDPVGETEEAEEETKAISFSASPSLLRDDASTKALTESFISEDDDHPDTFTIFGERITSAGIRTSVCEDVTVTHHYKTIEQEVSFDYWDYSPKRFWYWQSQSDRYDFVAISPADNTTINEHAQGNLSISRTYDYLTGAPSGGDQYDILASSYQRTGSNWNNRYNEVSMSFSHMGSAVGVKVQNNSSSSNITVYYIQYKNLVVSADAKVSLDNYGSTTMKWTNLTPSATPVRKLSRTPATSIGPGQSYIGEYQIMIPQNLSLYGATLVLNYLDPDDPNKEVEIPLAEIKRDDGTAITSWEIGYKYTYTISIRLDGGLLVTVTTTPWDVPVEAETPGILI